MFTTSQWILSIGTAVAVALGIAAATVRGRTRTALVVAAMLLSVAAATAYRLPSLDERPLHADEANNTFKFRNLWSDERDWDYDPEEFHGPTLYYATLPFVWASDATSFEETTVTGYRLVPVVFGVLLVAMVAGLSRGIGGPAASVAMALTAVSTPMVFYSRYYIHETLLVVFTLGALVTGWRAVRRGSLGWAALAGVCVGLMHATKETCVLAWAAMLFAAALVAAWAHKSAVGRERAWVRWAVGGVRRLLTHGAVWVGVLAAIATSVAFYSEGFTEWDGPLDSVVTYWHYLHRAGGEGSAATHEQPWSYYLSLLASVEFAPGRWWIPGRWWTEGLILVLAAVGAVAGLAGRGLGTGCRWLVRFLVLYTAALIAVYSAIPYKTPWTMLTFLHGLVLLAGVGAVATVRAARRVGALLRRRPLPEAGPAGRLLAGLATLVLATAAWHLAAQSARANHDRRFHSHHRNPYVYAHTRRDALRLVEQLEALAKVHPDGREMRIFIYCEPGTSWPLPFYLRGFDQVGYGLSLSGGVDPNEADVIITPREKRRALEKRLQNAFRPPNYRGLRRGVTLAVYVRKKLWQDLMARRSAK